MNSTPPSNLKGLTNSEAQERLKLEGYNELPTEKNRRFLNLVLDVIKEPMLLLLLSGGLIYLVLGDIQEAIVLLISVFFIIGITVYQENKTEKTLAALKNLASPQALVWRDSEYLKISGREVVREDLVFLNEGDRVPADGELIWSNNLTLDESLLTGESLPVERKAAALQNEEKKVHSGTLVVAGQGIFSVKSIGRQTEIGKIGKLLSSLEDVKTPLQKDFARLTRGVLVVGIFLCLAVVFLNYLSGLGLLPSFLSGIILAMAIFPEEFPVVLMIFLSIGAWRLSRHQVLVRKMSAVESLGAATVLAVDKTGTLTLNKMKVNQVYLSEHKSNEPLEVSLHDNNLFKEMMRLAALASKQQTFDPLEKAIKELKRSIYQKENIYQAWNLIKEYPLTSELFVFANAFEGRDDKKILICAKGAPEAIISLCHLNKDEEKNLSDQVLKMAKAGLRIIGVATSEPKIISDNIKDYPFKFIGLLGLADPIRPGVPEAIKECYSAGIKVKMITGDYPETGRKIAEKIGLENFSEVLSGRELAELSPEELKERINRVNVFARMVPASKLDIIQALKANQEVVAMTGDGVNDGPALKASDIGVAMGRRGTEVAREAADIVLLDDNFSSLVRGVREGRKIFDNLKRAMVYILAVHIPIAGLSLLPLLFGWPLILYPAHIVFLELIIDPICSIVFEAEAADKEIMKRAPRNYRSSILSWRSFLISLLQGGSLLLIIALAYGYYLHQGWEVDQARTVSFAILIFANLLLVLANRSWAHNFFASFKKANSALWPIMLFGLSFLALVIYQPFFRHIFKFTTLSLELLGQALLIAILPVLIFEVIKIIGKKKFSAI